MPRHSPRPACPTAPHPPPLATPEAGAAGHPAGPEVFPTLCPLQPHFPPRLLSGQVSTGRDQADEVAGVRPGAWSLRPREGRRGPAGEAGAGDARSREAYALQRSGPRLQRAPATVTVTVAPGGRCLSSWVGAGRADRTRSCVAAGARARGSRSMLCPAPRCSSPRHPLPPPPRHRAFPAAPSVVLLGVASPLLLDNDIGLNVEFQVPRFRPSTSRALLHARFAVSW